VCVSFTFFVRLIYVPCLKNSWGATAILSDATLHDKSARPHALAPNKCRTEIDGGTMRRSAEWSGKKDPPASGTVCADCRGVGIEWVNERKRKREKKRKKEREKSQGWNGAVRRPLIKIPWHIAVCYTTILYIRVQYTICAIHTHTVSCYVCVCLQYIDALVYVCVCVCVCQNPLT